MDRQQVLLAKTLEAAQVPLCIDTFDQRLILQKAVYLLQSGGLHLGYRYRWYLRGPYCSTVADHAFGIVGEGKAANEELATWSFDSTSETKASELRSLLNHDGESEHEQAKRLELLASILFLVNTKQAKSTEVAATNQVLHANGKTFTDEEVENAYEDLKNHGLLS